MDLPLEGTTNRQIHTAWRVWRCYKESWAKGGVGREGGFNRVGGVPPDAAESSKPSSSRAAQHTAVTLTYSPPLAHPMYKTTSRRCDAPPPCPCPHLNCPQELGDHCQAAPSQADLHPSPASLHHTLAKHSPRAALPPPHTHAGLRSLMTLSGGAW